MSISATETDGANGKTLVSTSSSVRELGVVFPHRWRRLFQGTAFARYGYVGVARVTGVAEPASRFQVRTADGKLRPIMEVVESPEGYHSQFIRNREKCEYFVPVHWLETKVLEEAVAGPDLYAIPNIVCRPKTAKWRRTLKQLKNEFPSYNR
jgi:hypothetical protein